MKIAPVSAPPTTPNISGLKLGIVRLGRVAGKVKYSLLDEEDINLVHKYGFEARLEIDKNGKGASIYAWAFDIAKGRRSGQPVHEFLWELHRGGLAPGWKVIHLNRITVDNRLENLAIRPKNSPLPSVTSQECKENSLYWVAINQLPTDPLDEAYGDAVIGCHLLNTNGDRVSEGGEEAYFECKYPPCTNLEQEIRQFSICGRCQGARYCGTQCQQKDWASHRKVCREKRRLQHVERPPER